MTHRLVLTCDMEADCVQEITHLDDKGYVYCTPHGIERQLDRRCRKLRPHELNRLTHGEPLAHY